MAPSILPCRIVQVFEKEESLNTTYKVATLYGIISDSFASSDFTDLSKTVSAELRQLDIKALSSITFIQACQLFTIRIMESCTPICNTSEVTNDDVGNEINTNASSNTLEGSIRQNTNEDNQNLQTNNEISSVNIDLSINKSTESIIQNMNNDHHDNERVLINIAEINNNITYLWKIRTEIICEYPKRTFFNTHGTGEISNWDLSDASGSITLVAFNLNSQTMSSKLKKNKAYEFTNLNIRPASDAFKTLSHQFQLLCTNGTNVKEIDFRFDHQHLCYKFVHLNQVNTIPMHSIIGRVLRDFGISTGERNDNIWSRRDIHIDQDGSHFSMTLWNSQARLVDRNMVGLNIKFKSVKVSWFDDELIILYQHSNVIERSLYELMTPVNQVKAYIDFEYYIDNNLDIKNSHIGPICLLKIFYFLLNFLDHNDQHNNDQIAHILQQFLILEASTSEKISYHFIHANPSILFENNITLGLFIKAVIHYSLLLITQHKCSSFQIDSISQKYTISDLLILLKPYVNTLRTCCIQCQLYIGYITIAEFSHLLVLDKQNQLTLAVDLNVYCKNQQFRLFDSVKLGKTNPLPQDEHYDHRKLSYTTV
ncbi:unnamed protein product [Rotaria magnacalcarata]|uniref:DNA-directed primase/polymerase protein n=2 Tax=Rotaria magnacalcarata TaxID=392030 RepID=A0A820CRL0_9BILA|nr:unnamed protein product [Rotaria magnacalcarata]